MKMRAPAACRRARGTALLTVLLVLLAVSIFGAAVVITSSRNLSQARARETSVGLSNCAMAIRHYISSQVAGGGALASLNFKVPGTAQAMTLQGGHYDNIQISSFTLPADTGFGGVSGSSVQNLANAMPMKMGSSATQVTGTAVCTDSNNRNYEVEFSFLRP